MNNTLAVAFQASGPTERSKIGLSKSTNLGMHAVMDRWVEFASCDQDVLGIVFVSGTENRVAWCMKARDGPSLVKTCESKANGSPSNIATDMEFESLELNNSTKEQWASIFARIIKTL